MENRFREKSVSGGEETLINRVREKGFALDRTRTEGAWNIYQLSTKISYIVPEIKDKFRKNGRPTERILVLWTRPNSVGMEINGSFTSGGQGKDREMYYSSTKGSVSETEILEFVDGYLEATREGRAYEPSH